MRVEAKQLILVVAMLALVQAQASADLVDITKIPEFPQDYEHEIYSGYLDNAPFDKSFFYFLFKSQNEHDEDPVVLWLGGSPWCSPLVAMTSENGPFLFEKGKTTMKPNPNSWNKKAHLLYLESPGGVGFSKSKVNEASDSNVKRDNYIALMKFFERFQYLRNNDFYIAGEGYAGVYGPQLANEIISNNKQESSEDRKINIKGLLLGNACTQANECSTVKYLSQFQVQFMYTRGFIEPANYSAYKSSCSANPSSDQCVASQKTIKDFLTASKINLYNVFDVCYPLTYNQTSNAEWLGVFEPSLSCTDTVGVVSLFNKKQYRPEFHAPDTTLKWQPCNSQLNYTIQSEASLFYLKGLVDYGLKLWYYSGDFDAMVPIQGTLSWLQRFRSQMGAPIKRSWRPWLWGGSKLGGMVWQLEGISFYSVVGAGHRAGEDKREAVEHVLLSFLERADRVEEE